MITDITDVSDKDVIEAAVRSVGGHVGIGSVVVTNLDTILCFDTPEQLMKCVAVLRQLYPGHLLADAVKCDGNHGGPACADPGCWQSEVPVVMHPKADECGSEPGLREALEMLYDVAFQDGESPDAQRVQRKELAVELAFRTLATPRDGSEPGLREALARVLPIFDRVSRDLVFTSDKAGQFIADMQTLKGAATPEQRAEPQRLHQAVWPSVASGFPCPACNGTGIQPPGFLDPSKAWP